LEVLQAAGIPDAPSRGLAASLGDGADVVVIAGIGPPPPPPMYLAGYVYIDAQGESVWLIRLPLLSVGAEVRLLDGLRERFAEIQGPLALESEPSFSAQRTSAGASDSTVLDLRLNILSTSPTTEIFSTP
jgi:hypothetical protein